jgi:hypothetical protein
MYICSEKSNEKSSENIVIVHKLKNWCYEEEFNSNQMLKCLYTLKTFEK